MNSTGVLYQSKISAQYFLRYATEADDAQLLELIAETMPSNGMTLSFERQPSYFMASHTQYNQPEIMVIYHADQPDDILGMMNIGIKNCYINGELSKMKFAADLRIKRHARGKQSLEVFMEYVFNSLSDTLVYQNIVLEDNKIARHLMHQPREGFATPYIYDQITTYTIAKVVKPSVKNDDYRVEKLTASTAHLATDFVAQMAQHYNFIPFYDFAELNQKHSFWLGLSYDDFSLVLNQHNDVVGLLGLWNQKSFKQTKVVHYSKLMNTLRPFYNLYAKFFGHIYLPEQGQSFDYLMGHSVLCDPVDKKLYAYLLYQLHLQTKARAKSAFCITLADNDPRAEVLKSCRAYKMKAIHGFHSFGASPEELFDRQRISYFETGRI